jgi:alpha-tubulin suppressor-like RCC1 family protein
MQRSAIAVGDFFVCGLRHGALYCWGRDYDGQLGLGKKKDPERCGGGKLPVCNRPVRVGNESDWTAIALGAFHSCGLRGKRLYCWGRNDKGPGDSEIVLTDEWPFLAKSQHSHPWPFDEGWLCDRDADAARLLGNPFTRRWLLRQDSKVE